MKRDKLFDAIDAASFEAVYAKFPPMYGFIRKEPREDGGFLEFVSPDDPDYKEAEAIFKKEAQGLADEAR